MFSLLSERSEQLIQCSMMFKAGGHGDTERSSKSDAGGRKGFVEEEQCLQSSLSSSFRRQGGGSLAKGTPGRGRSG